MKTKENPVWLVCFFDEMKVELPIYAARELAAEATADCERAEYWVTRGYFIPAGGTSEDDVDDEIILDVLQSYGCWTAEELADPDSNRRRILWVAANEMVAALS